MSCGCQDRPGPWRTQPSTSATRRRTCSTWRSPCSSAGGPPRRSSNASSTCGPARRSNRCGRGWPPSVVVRGRARRLSCGRSWRGTVASRR
ncbi:hypothetical protein [Ornithinimicrobium kibberense]|uniref:hypothetical protein n=1 Tax=Ornithinimicrobium kibberense TaxID=282060 RepID=UPI00361B7E21